MIESEVDAPGVSIFANHPKQKGRGPVNPRDRASSHHPPPHQRDDVWWNGRVIRKIRGAIHPGYYGTRRAFAIGAA
nr:hypothetical protein [Bradyrhizobium sp. Leo170]